MADALADTMRSLEPLTGQVCLIPVPLGARRLRTRGYNQSERIARALGVRVGRPVGVELLRRRRETRTQTALTPEGRHANVAGAFEARGATRRPCLLVDDGLTTGATRAAAGAALAGAGAARVEAVTFARAEPPVSLG